MKEDHWKRLNSLFVLTVLFPFWHDCVFVVAFCMFPSPCNVKDKDVKHVTTTLICQISVVPNVFLNIFFFCNATSSKIMTSWVGS